MEVRNVNLAMYSSLRVGGDGELVSVTSLREVAEAVMYAQARNMRVHILGGGTNTFFDEHLENILIIKNEIKGISFEEKEGFVYVTSGAGEVFDDLVLFSITKGLWGIENLSYIPGTVGAAPVQNIGAYGVELSDSCVSVTAFDTKNLTTVEISKEACDFGYRDSLFKRGPNRYIVLTVTLKLSKDTLPRLTYAPLTNLSGKENLAISDVRDLVIATRKGKLPDWIEYPNTGSFFKNPTVTKERYEEIARSYPDIPNIKMGELYKIPAAWLIEHVAKMKGVKEGDLGTWPSQPLVLVNYGKAKSREVLTFSEKIATAVYTKTGISLEREVIYVK